jgi:hypothetical protein
MNRIAMTVAAEKRALVQRRRMQRIALTVALGSASLGILVVAGIMIVSVDLGHWINGVAAGGGAVVFSALVAKAAVSAWRGQPIAQSQESEFRERGYVSTGFSQKRPDVIAVLFMLMLGAVMVPIAFMVMVPVMVPTVLLLLSDPRFFFIIFFVAFPLVLWSATPIYYFSRLFVNWRIARWMACEREMSTTAESAELPVLASRHVAAHVGGESERSVARAQTGTHAPRIRIISLLPEKRKLEKTRVSATSNVVKRHPMRLLYLWNFDAIHPRHDIRSWQQYGPVYWLWSPANVPYHSYLALLTKADIRSAFGTTSDDVTRWLATDLVPSRPRLFRRYGLYPQCSQAFVDDMWQVAVRGACQHSDAVIVDARAFTEARAGLTWEIRHAVTTLEPARYLILADQTTDLGALESVIVGCRSRGTGSSSSDPVRIVYEPAVLPVERLFDDERGPVRFDYRADRLQHLLQGPDDRVPGR